MKKLSYLILIAASVLTSRAESIEIGGKQWEYTVVKDEQPTSGVSYKRLRFPDYPLNVNLLIVDLADPGCRVETWCAKESSRGI